MPFTERREKMTSVSVSVKLLDILRRHQDNFNLCFATKNTIFSCEVRTSAAALEGTELGMISSLIVATNNRYSLREVETSVAVCVGTLGQFPVFVDNKKMIYFLREVTKNRYCWCYVGSSPALWHWACSARPQAGFWPCLWRSKYIWR